VAKEERLVRIGFLVDEVARLRRTVVDKAPRPIGVPWSQWWALANLLRHGGEGMMQTKLATAMDVGKVTLGVLSDRLEAAGLGERQGDPDDRRVKWVVMTARGTNLLSEIQAIAKDVNNRIVNGIAKNDIARAELVLHKMKQQLISMDAVPGGSATGESETKICAAAARTRQVRARLLTNSRVVVWSRPAQAT
jgi:MarR family transcriptional regulator for hemolysin